MDAIEYDKELDEAYKKTIYVIDEPSYSLRWNKLNQSWNNFCMRHSILYYAIITPYNPGSKQLSKAENISRLHQFMQEVQAEEGQFYFSRGIDPSGMWEAERGLVLVNESPERCMEYARKYEQNAFVDARLNEALRLNWLSKGDFM